MRRNSSKVGRGARSAATEVKVGGHRRRGEGRVGPALEGGEVVKIDVCCVHHLGGVLRDTSGALVEQRNGGTSRTRLLIQHGGGRRSRRGVELVGETVGVNRRRRLMPNSLEDLSHSLVGNGRRNELLVCVAVVGVVVVRRVTTLAVQRYR
jgi:hypothetical protein